MLFITIALEFNLKLGTSSHSFTKHDYPGIFSLFVCLFCVCVCVFTNETENCHLNEELCWNHDGAFVESVECFWWDGHFHYTNSSNHRRSCRALHIPLSPSPSLFNALKFL